MSSRDEWLIASGGIENANHEEAHVCMDTVFFLVE